MAERASPAVAGPLLVGPEGAFGPGDMEGLDEPVRRHLAAAIDNATPRWRSARIAMRGAIKLRRWIRFRAHEVLAPLVGFVWSARVGWVMAGWDRYVDGTGAMAWKLGGVMPVTHAEGPDVSRSAAARSGGEGMWLPTALLPRFGVRWEAVSGSEIVARFAVGDTPIEVHHELDADGRVRASWLPRWGDADGAGHFAWHRFGTVVTAHRRFGGLMIPSEGRAGWHYGTDRWPDAAFLRYEITSLEPVGSAGGGEPPSPGPQPAGGRG